MAGNFKKIHWTEHAKLKMRQYGLSKSKLMNILYRPERKEQGIAVGTTAVMQTNKLYKEAPRVTRVTYATKATRPAGEIWLMYKDIRGERKIISAWRYPGISKPGEAIPIPEEIRSEILNS